MKVLIVEDDPDARKVLSLILKLDGFEVTTAPGGPEAVKALQVEAPDLLLLDVMMPVMDGYEVCRWVRANPATAHLPVVMLSGKVDPESVTRGIDAGADDYLAKPIKPSNLTKQLRAIAMRV
ncbi:MAG TPA: response regulator, partial [Anaerolineae bacterium]